MGEQEAPDAAGDLPTPDAYAAPVPRPWRGSLAGRIDYTDDCDAPELGEELARDFGILR